MKIIKRITGSLCACAVLLFLILSLQGGPVMAQEVLHKANFTTGKGRSLVIKRSGDSLQIVFVGFDKPLAFEANGGGVGTCRTILKHKAPAGKITVSLAVPNPNSRCRMLPSYVSVDGTGFGISLDEDEVRKVAGSNAGLRRAVEKKLGKIDEPEG